MADVPCCSVVVILLLELLKSSSAFISGEPASSEPLNLGQSSQAGRPSFQSTDARQLVAYRSYVDVRFIHYSVPELTSRITWEFRANSTQRCDPKAVVVTIQYGGYPVINPDNTTYPPLLLIKRPYLNTVSLASDDVPVQLNISVPMPGDWFAVAYLKENTDKIVQKGLFRDCSTWLRSSVKGFSDDTVISLVSGVLHQSGVSSQHYFRFYAPENSWSALITITKCSQKPNELSSDCPVTLYVRARALPDFETFDISVNCTQASNDSCQLSMVPAESSWNYILVQVSEGVEFEIKAETAVCQQRSDEMSEVADVPQLSNSKLHKFVKPNNLKEKTEPPKIPAPEALRALTPPKMSCWPQIPLVRNNLLGNFAFRFDQVPDENGTTNIFWNVSSHNISLMKFDVVAMADSGGTLAVEMILNPFISKIANTSKDESVSVSACLSYLLRPKVSDLGKCESGMTFQVNNSAKANRVGTIMIPFPEAGRWYLSLFASCYTGDENNTMPIDCEENITSVLLQIKSAPCILGQCGHYGNCVQYISGGFLFSTCVCKAGWKGWSCTDNRDAMSDGKLLLAVLLLTLSNIVFLPAVILAIYRRYFTEALVYLVTMIFSTMYHACDSEVYSMCILRLSVLQFCDFYSAILAVWVTLLAMAELPTALLSLAHMFGAIGVALGVEYDRTGLWVFVIPVVMGLVIMTVSWIHHCSRQRSCYPRGRTWLACLLPGVTIAGTGLALFAFLETRNNYQYVHSGWHAAMALSILFLLPERRKTKDSAQWVMQLHWKPHGSFKFLHDNETDML